MTARTRYSVEQKGVLPEWDRLMTYTDFRDALAAAASFAKGSRRPIRIVREVREVIDEFDAAAPAEECTCETCGGEGTLDERLGGYSFSNPKANCPDCDGKGWWRRAATPAPLAQPASADPSRVDPTACPECIGMGCTACGGTGDRQTALARVAINTPASPVGTAVPGMKQETN